MERQDRNQIIMLGTGYATATHCYNTCFILKTPDTMLLVDAGGGNGILNQLEEAKSTFLIYTPYLLLMLTPTIY